jgi:uncharacterized protein YjbJ (UPF0337 family)
MSYQQPQQGYNAPSFGSNVPSTSSQVPTNIAGEEPSKLGGFSDRVMGAAKETAGKLFGNPELEAKGQAQRNIGQTEIQVCIMRVCREVSFVSIASTTLRQRARCG